MGLTSTSTGAGAADTALVLRRERPDDRIVALAGNPNVGKSTVFNALTGLRQHTGNWPGKTVTSAQGRCERGGRGYVLVDLPGTYSLMAHSAEEEVARDFLCFGGADGAVVVCDATCLERNLNLVLQTLELQPRTVVCVNLLDEAERKGVRVELEGLSRRLGVPVVGAAAGRGEGLEALMAAVEGVISAPEPPTPVPVRYPPPVEFAVASLRPLLEPRLRGRLPARWTALRLLEGDGAFLDRLSAALEWDPRADAALWGAVEEARADLERQGLGGGAWCERVVSALVETAEAIGAASVTQLRSAAGRREQRLDRLLTSHATGIPLMLLLLAGVLWLTITGANYPSQLLSDGLFWVQDRLSDLFAYLNAPAWLHGALVLGVYRVLAWVVSVMLPPMAIFFPLFTLLEDFGYLPRVAFVLDHAFQRAKACGKQALTMCMGFGCNAAGVVGCRIIDSPRERLLAILTNSFVPCNGRFPTLVNLILLFFVGTVAGPGQSVLSALLLTGFILLGAAATFAVTGILSRTVLRGVPSSFTLELPPYRRPQWGQVIVRSVFDRTLFVLARAVKAAAPAGLLLWLMANLTIGGSTILAHCAGFLEPAGRALGMDGVILLAFLLGLPANEIVVPIMLMGYLSQGVLQQPEGLAQMQGVFLANGWTPVTALCVMLFMLMHWPCATTLMTIRKETGSLKWTLLAAALPTLCGTLACLLVNGLYRLVT